MQPHDAYFIVGVLLPLLGLIGYFSARAEGAPIWTPLILGIIGVLSLGLAFRIAPEALNIAGLLDSILRLIRVFV